MFLSEMWLYVKCEIIELPYMSMFCVMVTCVSMVKISQNLPGIWNLLVVAARSHIQVPPSACLFGCLGFWIIGTSEVRQIPP